MNQWLAFWMALLVPISGLASKPPAGKYFDRVVFVVFENTEYDRTIKQPFFRELADAGAHFSEFYAISRPSQPNYLALTSGTTAGVKTNGNVNLDLTNVADLLEGAGISWRAYAEDFPGSCFTGATKGRYSRKHNPFISYLNIQRNPARCRNIVSASQFFEDARTGNLPQYVFYIPDNRNSGHDTGVKYANDWYERTFGPLVRDPAFMKDTVLVSTFDEGSFSQTRNKIYTSIVGPNVVAGLRAERLNLYGLLKLVEDNWRLPHLGREDASASQIPHIWVREN